MELRKPTDGELRKLSARAKRGPKSPYMKMISEFVESGEQAMVVDYGDKVVKTVYTGMMRIIDKMELSGEVACCKRENTLFLVRKEN